MTKSNQLQKNINCTMISQCLQKIPREQLLASQYKHDHKPWFKYDFDGGKMTSTLFIQIKYDFDEGKMTGRLFIQFKYDFGEGKMTSKVFLFSLNMILTKGK